MNEFKALRTFLSEHMVTKQDLAELRSEVVTKDELRALTKTIDGFAKMVKTITKKSPSCLPELRAWKHGFKTPPTKSALSTNLK